MITSVSTAAGGARRERSSTPARRRLRIFVPHASDTFTDNRPHGDGLVAFEVASRLAQRGHDVHVMAPSIDVIGAIPPTLHLHPLRTPLPVGLRGRLAYMLAVRSTFSRLQRENPFDVVHQLNPVFAGISLALAGSRVPVVLGAYVGAWPHDADSPNVMGSLDVPFAATVRRLIASVQQRHAAALILTTPAAEALIVDIVRERKKITMIPHGIDPNRYDPSPPRANGEEAATILFLGGTERRKGIYVLLDAFRSVYRALPQARLLIAGGGGRQGQVQAFVEKMPERDRIDFLGVVDRGQVPVLMSRAAVFAAPSFGEPFGMSLLEAMASGRPVVVTDRGGPAHIVDSAGGIKVPVGDPVALAAGLLGILTSPERAVAMGQHNRKLVESTYAWDRVLDRLEDVYATVAVSRFA